MGLSHLYMMIELCKLRLTGDLGDDRVLLLFHLLLQGFSHLGLQHLDLLEVVLQIVGLSVAGLLLLLLCWLLSRKTKQVVDLVILEHGYRLMFLGHLRNILKELGRDLCQM